MIKRLIGPPEVNISFDNRTYDLGDTVAFTVEADARRSFTVREGRADLLWTETYVFSGTMKIVDPWVIGRLSQQAQQSMISAGQVFSGDMHNVAITNRLVFEHHQESQVLLKGATLKPGRNTFQGSLRISDRIPRLEQGAILTCKLIVKLDVALGRNARVEKIVRVNPPRLP